jgi:ligand-binding sensor protein
MKGKHSMELRDLMNNDEWQRILDTVSGDFGIHTVLADAEGKTLLEGGQYNSLCSRIRAWPDSLTFVCSQTNRRMFQMAQKSGKPCSEFCEAGMFKTVAPVFAEGRFLGALSACGVALPDEPLDDFLVAKQLGAEEEEAKNLITTVPVMETEEAKRIAVRFLNLLRDRLEKRDQISS